VLQVLIPWPQQLITDGRSISPRDVFGNRLEALDAIRMDDEVWITLVASRDPPWQVEIRGLEMACVERAETHYRNLVQKVLTKTDVESSATNIILDEAEGSEVQLSTLSSLEEWWPDKTHQLVPRLLVSPMDAGSFRQETMHPEKLATVEQAIERALETIRFDTGSYDFAIRFGCLCLSGLENSEAGKVYPLRSFKKGIEGKVSCVMKKWSVLCLSFELSF
jgi:hypothetical protein